MSGRRYEGGAAGSGTPVAVVLGATGFVGRHVRAALADAGARVVGVARGVPGAEIGVPGAEAGVPGARGEVLGARSGTEWHALDLTAAGPDRLAGLLAEVRADVVVNAAGAVWGVTENQMELANAQLPRALVAACAALPHPPRLVQLGSVHEYGPVPAGATIREDGPTAPVNAYGRSKLAGARAVLDASAQGRADGLVLRVVNVSGPGAPRASLLGTVAAHLARAAGTPGAPAPLRLAPLHAHRDFVDVRDVADAVLAAARLDTSGLPAADRVVNIGRGEATGVRHLVRRLLDLAGADVPVIEEDDGRGQRGDVEWQRVDIGRAHRVLGWRPRRDLDTSLRDLLHASTPPAPAPLTAPLQ
ncbi:NAD(P)-dependent oxidoreductase [Streptomyces sp. WAC 01529]|uniref:NAD-dependent epimerase/dehydratase family protein n=1 Tax=Streptomyces sp. WAC 01529 TaxID=2203205 RepID=UPI0019D022A2|nr:NAD(P)-dependent oxidoreductase [Streptomyces sp. WAC 01529]